MLDVEAVEVTLSDDDEELVSSPDIDARGDMETVGDVLPPEVAEELAKPVAEPRPDEDDASDTQAEGVAEEVTVPALKVLDCDRSAEADAKAEALTLLDAPAVRELLGEDEDDALLLELREALSLAREESVASEDRDAEVLRVEDPDEDALAAADLDGTGDALRMFVALVESLGWEEGVESKDAAAEFDAVIENEALGDDILEMLARDDDDTLGDFVDESDAQAEGEADALAAFVTEEAVERLILCVAMLDGVPSAVITALRDESGVDVDVALRAAEPLGEDDDKASDVQVDE